MPLFSYKSPYQIEEFLFFRFVCFVKRPTESSQDHLCGCRFRKMELGEFTSGPHTILKVSVKVGLNKISDIFNNVLKIKMHVSNDSYDINYI